MKKTLFCLLTLLTISRWSTAQTISIADVETRTGGTAVPVALHVEGAESMTSMHIELSDPSGQFSIKSASASASWTALFSTGSAGMSAISTSDNAFSGDGIVATLVLSMPADIAVGTYPISIINARINGADVDGSTFNVTVTDYVTLDENSATAPEAADGVNVLVRRTINAGKWSTICLPFAMTEAQLKEAFGEDVLLGDFVGAETEFDDEDNVVAIEVGFESASAIEANRPYIIKVSQPVSEFTVEGVDVVPEEDEAYIEFDNGRTGSRRVVYSGFYGTYRAGTVLDEYTVFLSDNKFWYSMGQTRMNGFRAYFSFLDVLTEVEQASVKMFIVFGDDETKVEELTDRQTGDVYDLSGRRLGKAPRKGIYIMNGKTIVK